MTGLPDFYSSPLHLPFNRSSLEQLFELQPPDFDPGGAGFSLILGADQLVVSLADGNIELPQTQGKDSFDASPLYVGLWRDKPCRLVELASGQQLPEAWDARSITEENPRLPITLLTLGGIGRMILHWEKGSRHCATCGERMRRLPGGWGKLCAACGANHFPHIHPCVIALVRRDREVLLTRKAQWIQNRYSLVAGFAEFGECLEEAVVREVKEETGVLVQHVRYIGSQCWPFPSQLMCGFVAEYAGGEVQVDQSELEDARWFRTDSLPKLPPKRSIARYLLDSCLEF